MAVCGASIYDSHHGRPRHRPDRCEPPIRTAARQSTHHPTPAAHTPNTRLPNTFPPRPHLARLMIRITSTPFPATVTRGDMCEPFVTSPLAGAAGAVGGSWIVVFGTCFYEFFTTSFGRRALLLTLEQSIFFGIAAAMYWRRDSTCEAGDRWFSSTHPNGESNGAQELEIKQSTSN